MYISVGFSSFLTLSLSRHLYPHLSPSRGSGFDAYKSKQRAAQSSICFVSKEHCSRTQASRSEMPQSVRATGKSSRNTPSKRQEGVPGGSLEVSRFILHKERPSSAASLAPNNSLETKSNSALSNKASTANSSSDYVLQLRDRSMKKNITIYMHMISPNPSFLTLTPPNLFHCAAATISYVSYSHGVHWVPCSCS